ncbi:RHS repeat domain-containing protein [Sunxiuqinia sp. A32]|uniref:RHS repeat domain-containing protein n=1 Tax=Sunxiuqinia sp. A32 TaxID=3461496 RepID=UPI0040467F39
MDKLKPEIPANDSTEVFTIETISEETMETQVEMMEAEGVASFVNQIISPSPNASSLGQYGDVPVGNYTGVPNISIPLYSIKSGDIELPITLSYHASGIKVTQEASWVGLGWALNAGGVITRAVRGQDDLKHKGYLEVSELPSTSSNIPDFSDPDFDFFDQKPIYDEINAGNRDGEPDLFFYNFLGQSGKMIFERNNGSVIKGIPLNQSGITFSYDNENSVWTVIDEKGWKYSFGTKEITYNYSTSGRETFRYTRLDTIGDINYLDHATTSAWYIDRIDSPKGDYINFSYDEQDRATISQLTYNETQHQAYSNLSTPVFPGNVWYGTQEQQYYYNVAASMQRTSDVYLSRIDFNNGYVEFITSDKEDMRQEYHATGSAEKPQRLDEIKVFNSNDVVFKKISFSYSYFNGQINTYNKENYWRLKLNSVQESFYNQENSTYSTKPPYVFSYNSVNLPAKNSAAIDHWGYYNGQLGNDKVPYYLNRISGSWNNFSAGTTLVISDESPDIFQKYFVPHAVFKNPNELLPSGSHLFQEGAFREVNIDKMKASILTKIEYPTGGATKLTFEPNNYNAANDNSPIGPFEDKLNEINILSDDGDEPDVESFSLTHCARVWIDCKMESYYHALNTTNIKAIVEKATGEDIVCIQPINESSNAFSTRVEIFLPPGDYRLVADRDNDWDNNRSIELKAKYISREFNDTKVGGGLRIAKIETLDLSGQVVKTKQYSYEDEYYLGTTGIAMTPITHFYFNGQYERDATSTSDGPFNSTLNILIRSSNNEIPLGSSAQGNFVGYSLVKVFDVDQSNNSLGESVYHYTNEPEELTPYHLPGIYGKANHANGELRKEEHFNESGDPIKIKEFKYRENESETFIAKATVTPFTMEYSAGAPNYTLYTYYMRFYDVVSNWRYPYQTIDTSYDENGGNPVVITTDLEYNNADHKQLTKQTQTDINNKTIITDYVFPSDPGSNAPSEMWDESNVNYKHMLSPVIDKTVTVGGVITSKTHTEYDYSQDMVLPVYQDIYPTGTGEVFKINYKHDDKGNIIQQTKEDDISTYYLWAYNNQYPIAKIESPNESISIETIQTAIEDLLLSGSDDKTAIDTDIGLIEGEISSNLGELDMLTIYTYEPLIGMTSQTDPSGRTTYYEYDDFGRLEYVRDTEGNIVNKYRYHYATQE